MDAMKVTLRERRLICAALRELASALEDVPPHLAIAEAGEVLALLERVEEEECAHERVREVIGSLPVCLDCGETLDVGAD